MDWNSLNPTVLGGIITAAITALGALALRTLGWVAHRPQADSQAERDWRNELRSELDSTRARLDKVETENNTNQLTIIKLQGESSDKDRAISGLERRLKNAEEELRTLREQRATEQSECVEIRKERDLLKSILAMRGDSAAPH